MTTTPKTQFLKDYKIPDYMVKHIDLVFDIYEEKTIVSSQLQMERAPGVGVGAPIELMGENLRLISVKKNGVTLTSADYQVSPEKLTILKNIDEKFILDIEVEIYPHSNTACEGLYLSGKAFCTQCEPEGFRKITYYVDRPDNMATFKARVVADKKNYPYLLCNGNKMGQGDLENGRHFVDWEDPFKKPSYLFALVAGNFDVLEDSFTTCSGRQVKLEIYVDPGNLEKSRFAMESLKHAMRWDEETYGLEYDLDIYMIVAVDSFNMGAMENKGLNIFNSSYVLANEKAATDADFQNIEGVIGHEYFHNWTGNRVTCRDWFQLTLKEGLTVYRDQEFSSDMQSRPVKRIEDVKRLKENQFPEDAGPMSHPIRPESFIEINNFYTMTIYEKGAEVIRMIETLIGKENFKKGMTKYFELFDGQAVTTEDFVKAMELASGKNLSQFKNWYSRSGTPTLKIRSQQDGKITKLKITQEYPKTPLTAPAGNILHVPLKLAFYNENGTEILHEKLIELTQLEEEFEFHLTGKVIPSLNRGFSAPVHIDYPYSISDLQLLMGHDTDSFNRYESAQKVYLESFKKITIGIAKSHDISLALADVATPWGLILKDNNLDPAFKAHILALPHAATLYQELNAPNVVLNGKAMHVLNTHLAQTYEAEILALYEQMTKKSQGPLSAQTMGARALKNLCLHFLSGLPQYKELVKTHFQSSQTMTEELSGLKTILSTEGLKGQWALDEFDQKWRKDSLVMQKWFGAQAASLPAEDLFSRLKELESHPAYQAKVPNFIRAIYMTMAKVNMEAFHHASGQGYKIMADKIIEVDQFNPQIASRLSTVFSFVSRSDIADTEIAKGELLKILNSNPSKDTFEIVSKMLA